MLYEIRKHALDLAEKQKLVMSGELPDDADEEDEPRRHRKKKSKPTEIVEEPASPADVEPNPIDAAELTEQRSVSDGKQAKKKRKHEVEDSEVVEKPKLPKAEKEARREEKQKHKHKSAAPAPESPKPIAKVAPVTESIETTPKRKKTDVELQVSPATDASTPSKAILKKKASISASEPRRG